MFAIIYFLFSHLSLEASITVFLERPVLGVKSLRFTCFMSFCFWGVYTFGFLCSLSCYAHHLKSSRGFFSAFCSRQHYGGWKVPHSGRCGFCFHFCEELVFITVCWCSENWHTEAVATPSTIPSSPSWFSILICWWSANSVVSLYIKWKWWNWKVMVMVSQGYISLLPCPPSSYWKKVES